MVTLSCDSQTVGAQPANATEVYENIPVSHMIWHDTNDICSV